jgi:hypothetical protein
MTQGIEFVKPYLVNILLVTNNIFADHLTKLEMVLVRLSIAVIICPLVSPDKGCKNLINILRIRELMKEGKKLENYPQES